MPLELIGFKAQDLGHMVQALWFGVQCSGLKAWGSRSGVQGLGSRVWGLPVVPPELLPPDTPEQPRHSRRLKSNHLRSNLTAGVYTVVLQNSIPAQIQSLSFKENDLFFR